MSTWIWLHRTAASLPTSLLPSVPFSKRKSTAATIGNASTLDKHIELDWSMTTIFVPQQKWVGKEKNHLQFIFHLTGKKNGMLHVSMSPGTIIYFHGSLLTHQQVHNCGEVTGNGCCLNFSAYANRALLCNFITTINRIKQKKK